MMDPSCVAELRCAIDTAPELQSSEPVDDEYLLDDELGIVSYANLREQYPTLHQPVIHGLLRQGEVANVIAPPKAGKSWLVHDLAWQIVTAGHWLDAFACVPGYVLLIDNELHCATLAHRLGEVAEARGIEANQGAYKIDILTLRGRGCNLKALGHYVSKIEAGHYRLIICDAWYRFVPHGTSENDNAGIMSLYNLLDDYAAQSAAAWLVIHHASKGNQGEKSITDVGAGAGAQSRAADTHIILRPHEEDGCHVLQAVTRSFATIEPLGLRWHFPLWRRAYNLDTTAIKGRKSRLEERQSERDHEGLRKIIEALSDGPMSVKRIRTACGGMGKDRAERLLMKLESERKVTWEERTIRGGTGRVYSRIEPGMPTR